LLEPRKKRVAFLEEVVRDLGLENCEVVAQTAEEAAADSRYSTKHALAIARALAPPAEAVRLMMPLVAPEGSVALFIGRGATLPPGAEEVSEGLAIVRADKGKEGSADAGTIF
jgi:16S rRNA (guanine527-N7)-methyltransferase